MHQTIGPFALALRVLSVILTHLATWNVKVITIALRAVRPAALENASTRVQGSVVSTQIAESKTGRRRFAAARDT